MKLVKELIITLLFLALYTPLSIAIWYKTGKTANLLVVMLIGLSIITIYIYFEIARHKIRKILRQRFRRTIPRTYVRIKSEYEIEEKETEKEVENLVGFRNLFSQNKHGGEAI